MKLEWSTVVMFGIMVTAGVVLAVFKIVSPETAIALIAGSAQGSLMKPMLGGVDKSSSSD